MELVRTDCDYHIHTLNFSDGLNTIEEVVQYAGKIGLTAIAITDHSDENMRAWNRELPAGRGAVKRWKNVHNDVNVLFGVEADVLNEKGDICDTIEGIPGDIIILSAHRESYRDNPSTITQAYINAINRFHERIDVLGHVDAVYFGDSLNVIRVVEEANRHGLVVELNAKNLCDSRNVPEKTLLLLEHADKVMVNSDAHCLSDLDNREEAFSYLRKKGFVRDGNA